MAAQEGKGTFGFLSKLHLQSSRLHLRSDILRGGAEGCCPAPMQRAAISSASMLDWTEWGISILVFA
jgi:hypothetical protein